MLKQKLNAMEKRITMLKQNLPIYVLFYEDEEFSLSGNREEKYKTLEEFRNAYFLPDNYNPIVIEIVPTNVKLK